jgi:hypothetical protein
MKIRIKTAHGYISFQPPLGGTPNGVATMQYRENAGAWEECEVEGWDYETVPDTPPPVEEEWPGGITPSQSVEYVAAIKDWLLREGVNLQGPCGAFEICRNVALGLVETGCGLLFKDTGNNCQQRSTDIVCYKDFNAGATRIIDILSDSGNLNTPTWQEKGPEDNVAMDRWRSPYESSPTSGNDSQTMSRSVVK